MFFDAATLEMVRKANAEERYDVLYVMVPADDGDQSYELADAEGNEMQDLR